MHHHKSDTEGAYVKGDRLWDDAIEARVEAVERDAAAEQARSGYHEAIRRLHASGVSLREIARRLEVSHQRVHQIVTDTACGFCTRRRADVGQLVAGPGVFVCDRCVALGLHALAEGWGARDERVSFDVAADPSLTCCFCRKPVRKAGSVVSRGAMRICGHCLVLASRCMAEAEPRVGA